MLGQHGAAGGAQGGAFDDVTQLPDITAPGQLVQTIQGGRGQLGNLFIAQFTGGLTEEAIAETPEPVSATRSGCATLPIPTSSSAAT